MTTRTSTTRKVEPALTAVRTLEAAEMRGIDGGVWYDPFVEAYNFLTSGSDASPPPANIIPNAGCGGRCGLWVNL
jgi:hypothetical protein